jgi:hypothetical protein
VVAVGGGAEIENGVLSLPKGGLVVHTDIPKARHGALELAPGCWRFRQERELGDMGQIVAVKD